MLPGKFYIVLFESFTYIYIMYVCMFKDPPLMVIPRSFDSLIQLFCIFLLPLSLSFTVYNLYMVCNLHENRNHQGKVGQMYKTTVALFSLLFCQDIQASDRNYRLPHRWKLNIK